MAHEQSASSDGIGLTDPHEPLRRNVRLLGDILGATIREQEGQWVLDKIEAIRRLSKNARKGSATDRELLIATLSSMPADELVLIARAFSHYLNLANIAEQHHRVRRRRDYQRQSSPHPQPGSIDELLPRLLEKGVTVKQIARSLADLQIEFVLTAHPTEVSRRTLMRKFDAIAHVLEALDHDDFTPGERDEQLRQLRRLLISSWHTDEIRRSQPTPVDEAIGGIAVIEQILWQAVPKFLGELDAAMFRHLGNDLPFGTSPIRFASWIGGDRDGNPNVTAAVTEEVCLLARWKAADLYLREIEGLYVDLSMSKGSDELREFVGDSPEPYRALLRKVRDRLAATKEWVKHRHEDADTPSQDRYLTTDQLRDPLMLCYRSLVACGMKSVAKGVLQDILRRLDCFGLSLLRLDIRQEASRHAAVFDAITRDLGLGSYLEWNESKRQEFLLQELQSNRPVIPRGFQSSEEVSAVLNTFTVMAKQPLDSLGSYVVSMASQPSDVLCVMLLQREAGMVRLLPVVPLYETLDDLNGAADCVNKLLGMDWYKAAIDKHQQVMIGYSDSAKDAGFLAASWARYRAQEALAAVCRSHDVRLTFFHGRGGSVSRGGALAHSAILSQPPGSLSGSVRVTEQGEVIRFKFGLLGIAMRTLDVYTSATLEAIFSPPPDPKPAWRALMDQMAESSLHAYRHVVGENAQFIQYFRALTPESELQRLPIGSRPARRGVTEGVGDLRAIPWVFAWTQVRLMLPAWLGVGEALQEAITRGHEETIREMANEWPFFRSALDMLVMVLAKTEPQIAEYYEQRLTPPLLHALGRDLRCRLAMTVAVIKQITGNSDLLEHDPVIRRSIDVRNPYLDPLNILQAEVLDRLRKGAQDDDGLLERALMVTIAGINAGMRNTG